MTTEHRQNSDVIEIAWDEKALSRGRAVYHFTPALLEAFGKTESHDVSSALGLLEYIMDFANRPMPRIGADAQGVGRWAAVWRGEFRDLLQLAARGPTCKDDPSLARPSDAFLAEIQQGTADIHWQHTLTRTRGGAVWRHHALIGSPAALHALIASLLMDPKIRERAGECRYKDCGKYFVVGGRRGRSGRPNIYCCVAHGEKANNAGSTARKRKERACDRLARKRYDATAIESAVEQAMRGDPEATPKRLVELAEKILLDRRAHK